MLRQFGVNDFILHSNNNIDMLLKRIFQLVMMILLPGLLLAQVTTSSITGLVKTSDGKSVDGASIVATHQPSGSVYNTTTQKDGLFTLPNLKVGGPYKVEIKYVGLQPQVYNDVYLQLGEPLNISVLLLDKNTLTEVVVSSRKNSLISSERQGTSMQISQQQLQALPTINRNINDFVRLLPQAQSRYNADGTTAGISIAGQSNKYNQFSIDGVNSTDIFGLASSGTNGGQAGINPIPFDAIEQVQVILSPYDVTQGGFTGGGFNAVTKSGTNQYHGSVFGMNQNAGLVGKSAADRSKYGKFYDWNYGASIGGPIIKNKLFFFAAYEGERRSTPVNLQPGTAGSNISLDVVNSLSTWLQDESKHSGWSYNPGAVNGINTTRDADAVFARIDWNINDKNKLTIRNSYTYGKSFIFSDAQNSMSFYNNGYAFQSKNNSTVLELNTNFSNKLSNMLRVTYTATRDKRATPGDPFPAVQIRDGSLTYYFGTDYSSQANSLKQNNFTLTDNLNLYAGKHTITIGTNNEFYNTNNIFVQSLYGRYVYNSLNDFYTNAAPNAYYHFYPTKAGNDGASVIHAAQFGLYVQDQFTVTDNFKLNYGLRADLPVFFNKPEANSAFNSSSIATSNNVATNKVPKSVVLLSPRIGFNWDVLGNKTLQIRGGAGIFTGRVPLVWISNQYGGTGVLLNRYTAPASDRVAGMFNPSNPPSGNGSKINEIDVTAHNFKFPRTFRANLAIDKKLPWGVVGTIEAIYTKTIQDIRYQDLNLAPSASQLHIENTSRPFYGSMVDGSNYSNIVLLANTSKGYAYNLSAQLQKQFSSGWSASIAYSLGHSYGLNDGTSSTAMSNYRFAYNVNGLGNLDQARNNYDAGSAIKAFITKKFNYGKFYSQIGLVYQGTSGQTISYVYYGDLNGDDGTTAKSVNTSNSADLIYFPTNASSFTYLYNTTNGVATSVKYTPQQQFDAFNDYMNSTDYTKKNKGKNGVRNGARMPWENHFDVKLVQGFKIDGKKSIELLANIMNASAIFSKNWGHSYYLGNQVATPLNVAATTSKYDASIPASQRYTTFDPSNPKMTYDPQFGLNKYTSKPWAYSDLLSRWRMQLGVRFNF